MEPKKLIQSTVASVLIAAGSFTAGGQMNENGQKVTEMQQAMAWSNDDVKVFEQQQAVIRRQKTILEKWDSCQLCKERCSTSQ